jgi:hypothetical protein
MAIRSGSAAGVRHAKAAFSRSLEAYRGEREQLARGQPEIPGRQRLLNGRAAAALRQLCAKSLITDHHVALLPRLLQPARVIDVTMTKFKMISIC